MAALEWMWSVHVRNWEIETLITEENSAGAIWAMDGKNQDWRCTSVGGSLAMMLHCSKHNSCCGTHDMSHLFLILRSWVEEATNTEQRLFYHDLSLSLSLTFLFLIIYICFFHDGHWTETVEACRTVNCNSGKMKEWMGIYMCGSIQI